MGNRVQRRDVAALFQVCEHLLVDEHRLGQPFAAVDDAVADGADLVHIGQAAVLLVQQAVDERLRRLRVGGHGNLGGEVGLAGGVVRDFAVDADALTKPLGDDLPRVHIEKLILQRRAARVDYEYIHDENKLPFLLHGRRKRSGRLLFLTIRTETIILPLLRNCKSFSAVCGPEKRKRKIHKQTRRRACRPAA